MAATKGWEKRKRAWLEQRGPSNPFRDANVDSIARCLTDEESGFRMVVNIPADALMAFLTTKRYLNAYDLPVVAGKRRGPSKSRLYVDDLLALDKPEEFFFGAVSMGGTGIRFYGEYCMVLKREAVAADTQVFNSNSYDLLCPPHRGKPDMAGIVESMKGRWSEDTVDMLVLKVLPELSSADRLVTLGTVSDAVLHDEDFIEVHKKGRFGPAEVEEIRETPEDQAIHGHILDQFDAGSVPRLEEVLWIARRLRVRQMIRGAKLRSRVVASAGRGSRWD